MNSHVRGCAASLPPKGVTVPLGAAQRETF